MRRPLRFPKTPGLLPGVFVCALVFCASIHADCPPTARLEAARVDHVIDGDTLVLTDGRHVRLIGVNAPETGHRDRPGEPLGQLARKTLMQWLPRGASIYLQPGAEARDRYGRALAHVFRSERGDSVEEALLHQGLAQHVAIPPNTDFATCLAGAEQDARRAGRGLWSEPYFAPRDAGALTAADAGYRRVRVRIERVQHDRGGWWLESAGPLVLRLTTRDAAAFDGAPDSWAGRTLVVRGWVRDRGADAAVRRRGFAPLLLTVQHPAMVESGL